VVHVSVSSETGDPATTLKLICKDLVGSGEAEADNELDSASTEGDSEGDSEKAGNELVLDSTGVDESELVVDSTGLSTGVDESDLVVDSTGLEDSEGKGVEVAVEEGMNDAEELSEIVGVPVPLSLREVEGLSLAKDDLLAEDVSLRLAVKEGVSLPLGEEEELALCVGEEEGVALGVGEKVGVLLEEAEGSDWRRMEKPPWPASYPKTATMKVVEDGKASEKVRVDPRRGELSS
jgi:hypothetical protein